MLVVYVVLFTPREVRYVCCCFSLVSAIDHGSAILSDFAPLRGVHLGSSEIVRHGFLMKIRERETPVGGSTPKVFAGRKKQILKKEGK
jgi:hypothetical protein